VTAFLIWVRTLPNWVWTALIVAALVGGTYLKGRHDGKEVCQRAQEAAEAKADAKAATVAKRAQERAQKAGKAIRERTEEVADEVQREMDAVVCPDALPSGVRDRIGDAVRRARESLPAE
jgi:ribosomal protein L12E/L44/L45/RPP1/RPP2